jgi:hypothetical protein
LPVAAIPCITLRPIPFLDLSHSLITMYKHNRCWGNTSRNRSHNTDLSIYGPQAGWLHYCLGHPVWHAHGEFARDLGIMSSGTSLL